MSTLFDLPFEEPPDEPADDGRGAAQRRIYTVSELTTQIRGTLEQRFFEVWVEGELSNCRVWNTGHMYFTLKDAGAQVKGVMFRSSLRLLRFAPQDGLRVVARGRITVYDPKGEYQIVCEHLEPEGLGARQLAFEQLKARLTAEGLFAAARKRPIPELPRKVGVVTSLDGAAVRDIIQVLRRRYANVHIVVRPTRVQGEGAALEIARALRAIGKVPDVDVVIVGRGGGSIEDLWAFNEEVVVRAIAGCPVPTIAAVGHESDVTLADFVADARAATPSAAAEMVLGRKDEVYSRIDRLARRLESAISNRRGRLESRLRTLENRPGLAGFHARVAMRGRRAVELRSALHHGVRSRLSADRRTMATLTTRLAALDVRHQLGSVRRRLDAHRLAIDAHVARRRQGATSRLATAIGRLDALSPLAVLARGYALCWTDDRATVIRRASQVQPGDTVRVRLGEGELRCDVRE
ncbi:MAG TPA: exodeoxyribonuclease VII large subunit [Vicinamibacterales bacterium]